MQISAQERKDVGTSASRRLRRANQVPGIVYGGEAAPIQVALDHNTLYHALRVEAFHSSILDMDIDGKKQRVLLRNVQWHPYKQQVLHVDFQRVAANQKITVKVPLHFINGENSPAVKQTKAVVNHVMTEIEVQVLPKDLPEFIEVDLAELAMEHSIHLSSIKLPKGVTAVVAGPPPMRAPAATGCPPQRAASRPVFHKDRVTAIGHVPKALTAAPAPPSAHQLPDIPHIQATPA